MRTAGPVVIIGGAGQIGSAVAEALANEGTSVVSVDRYDEFQSEESLFQGELFRVSADVTSKESLQSARDRIQEEMGVPTGLVYFAHYKGPRELEPGADFFSRFEDYPLIQWERAIAVNLTGLMLSCQIFGFEMAQAGRGSIVTVSSTYGVVGPDPSIYGNSGINSPVPYATTKAGIIGFTRYLAAHWGRSGVRTNCLVPGGVAHENQAAQFVSNYVQRTTLGRMATPADYIGPTKFLLSEASSYMNGSLLVVDGGWTSI